MTSVHEHNSLRMFQFGQWMERLSDINDIDMGNTYLAGGAVRDLICNKYIRDLDIYVPNPQMHKWPKVTKHLKDWGLRQAIKDTDNASEAGDSPINAVYIDDESTINLIFMANGMLPSAHVGLQFDIGLCKAMMDSEGKIMVNSEFLQDYEAKTLTWTHTPYMTPYSISKSLRVHLPKIRKKYDDYNLIIKPDEYDPVSFGSNLKWEDWNE